MCPRVPVVSTDSWNGTGGVHDDMQEDLRELVRVALEARNRLELRRNIAAKSGNTRPRAHPPSTPSIAVDVDQLVLSSGA